MPVEDSVLLLVREGEGLGDPSTRGRRQRLVGRVGRVHGDTRNLAVQRTIGRLIPTLRRIERLRFGTLSGRRSVQQHAQIIELAATGDATVTAAAVRDNWLTLGAVLDASFPDHDREAQ
jgi:hypothetical protein